MKININEFNKIVHKQYKIIKLIKNPFYFAFDWLFPWGSNPQMIFNDYSHLNSARDLKSILLKKIIFFLQLFKTIIKLPIETPNAT